MKQSEIIKKMSDKEFMQQVLLSQCLFMLIGIIISIFTFDSIGVWLEFLFIDWNILYLGVIPSLFIVLINILLSIFLPKDLLDDGGINEKLFRDRKVSEIFFIAMFVALAEELLFRGAIQTQLGFIVTSIIFALVHIRYLRKPFLFFPVLIISFYLGYIFEITQNLLITIVAHFIIDFLLGLFIRFRK